MIQGNSYSTVLPSSYKNIILTATINLSFEGVVSSQNIHRAKELNDHAFVVESVGAGAFGEFIKTEQLFNRIIPLGSSIVLILSTSKGRKVL